MRLARWRALAPLLRGSRRLLLASLVIALLQSALLVPIGLLIRHAFDVTMPAGDGRSLVAIGAAVLALFLTSAGLGLANRYMSLRVTKDAVTRLRSRLLEKIYGLPQSYFDHRDLGKLQSVVVHDSERLDVMTNALVALVLPASVIAAALGVTLAILNATLFALLCAMVPVLLLLARRIGRAVRGRTRVWQRSFDEFSSQTGLALRAMRLTKVHGAEALELASRRAQFDRLGVAGRTMAWMQAAYTLVNGTVAAAAGVAVLVVGGRAVTDGAMSIGDLVSFFAVTALLRGQLNVLLVNLPQIVAGSESLSRLEEILETDSPEPYSGRRRLDFQGALALDAVDFSYGDEPLVRDLTLRIEAGERVALVGPNGAGKSTVVSLLLGLYRPQQGHVRADGLPFEDLDLELVRRRIGVLLQDPIVFGGTVAENIAYGRPEASMEEIRRAAVIATADHFIAAMPRGYDSEVGDAGVRLSGGQRQRIALARAMLGGPSLLILDEPSTHLDDEAIGQLTANLTRAGSSTGVLLVTHDEGLARAADRVYRIRNGRLVDSHSRSPVDRELPV